MEASSRATSFLVIPYHAWQRSVVDRYNDALAIDMESVGVARAVHEAREYFDYNPRFLVIRGISDLVRTRHDVQADVNSQERSLWKPYASGVAAAFATRIVDLFCETPSPRLSDVDGMSGESA